MGAVALTAVALSGCATRRYVEEEVGRVEVFAQGTQAEVQRTQSEVQAAQAALATHDQRLAGLDTTTRQAMERALAAGKLAEGKFLYSVVLSDDSIKFPTNRHELSPEAQARLARAEAVRRYLSRQGIALNRMATISYGEEEPAVPNSTRDGRAQNRRVVVVVLS